MHNQGRAWRPSFVYLAMALGLVVYTLAQWLLPSSATDTAPATQATPPVARSPWDMPAALESNAPAQTAAVTPPPPPAPESRLRDPNGDLTPDLRDYLNAGEKPTMNEVLDRLHRAGVYTGVAAFSPPGTSPPLLGLAVPENFVLPPGYARHHQTTDDGQSIEPILMYAPDHQLFDSAGQPIALPKDLVVPREHAPPGLPIRLVVIPKPTEPDPSN